MPKADIPPTSERPIPLFVEVGKNYVRTRLMSVQFRRALKSATHSCVEKHRELCRSVRPLPPSTVIEIPTHHVYLRALLYVLAMKIDGHCDTIKQQNWINQLELESINDQLTPWGRLRSYCISHNASVDQKNRVRLARVSEPSSLCRIPLLSEAIGNLVADIELQDSLSRLELDLEEPAPWCPPHEGAMMRTPIPWRSSDPSLVLARDDHVRD